jgi:hypothetical protein
MSLEKAQLFFGVDSSPASRALNWANDEKRRCAAIGKVQIATALFLPSALKHLVCVIIKLAIIAFAATFGQIPAIKARIWSRLENTQLVSSSVGKSFVDIALHLYRFVMFMTFSPLCCLFVGLFAPHACTKAHDVLKVNDSAPENPQDEKNSDSTDSSTDSKETPKLDTPADVPTTQNTPNEIIQGNTPILDEKEPLEKKPTNQNDKTEPVLTEPPCKIVQKKTRPLPKPKQTVIPMPPPLPDQTGESQSDTPPPPPVFNIQTNKNPTPKPKGTKEDKIASANSRPVIQRATSDLLHSQNSLRMLDRVKDKNKEEEEANGESIEKKPTDEETDEWADSPEETATPTPTTTTAKKATETGNAKVSELNTAKKPTTTNIEGNNNSSSQPTVNVNASSQSTGSKGSIKFSDIAALISNKNRKFLAGDETMNLERDQKEAFQERLKSANAEMKKENFPEKKTKKHAHINDIFSNQLTPSKDKLVEEIKKPLETTKSEIVKTEEKSDEKLTKQTKSQKRNQRRKSRKLQENLIKQLDSNKTEEIPDLEIVGSNQT